MAQLFEDAEAYFARTLGPRSRVLLINPPVEEKRYHWLRWNQPLDLLRLSTRLKALHPGLSTKLFDFMLPDETGAVHRHKVKETWLGASEDLSLWHFGRRFEEFGPIFGKLLQNWVPDAVVVTSLTSYWHVSIEKLFIQLCNQVGRDLRKQIQFVLCGNYPRFEPEHAARQPDVDAVLTSGAVTEGCVPDFPLYLDPETTGGTGRSGEKSKKAEPRLPAFFALDISDPNLTSQIQSCIALVREDERRRRTPRPQVLTLAFFNDDVCGPQSRLHELAELASACPGDFVIEGIAGIEPRSLCRERLDQLKRARFRTLFVEHARTPGGGVDVAAYEPLLAMLRDEARAKKAGESVASWLETGGVTGFISIGLPDDDMDELVRSTLLLNKYFQAIVIKPFGYSPEGAGAQPRSLDTRRAAWRLPRESSPQWFPYVDNGSGLSKEDYGNLLRWQNLLNKRVRGTTFDFLDDGTVARLVRETLVSESWKPRVDAK